MQRTGRPDAQSRAPLDLERAAAVLRRHAVTVEGRPHGPDLVLVHGFGCDQDVWLRLLPAFVDDARVVRFDQVGAGRSDLSAYDPDRYATLDAYADDLLEVCAALDLQRAVLVGHSSGAMIALTAAVRQPERVGRLVLLAPSPCFVDDPADGYVGGFSREDVDELLASLDHNYFAWAAATAPRVMGSTAELGAELTASFCRTDPDVARDFARLSFLSDCRPLLDRVGVPCLVLQCRDDVLAPPQVGRYLARRIADCTLVELAATGHCPHVSAPAETAAAVRAHLGTGA